MKVKIFGGGYILPHCSNAYVLHFAGGMFQH